MPCTSLCRDHRILREPDDRPTAAKPSGSLFPLVRLDGDVDPEHPKSLDRELAIAVVAYGTRRPNTPQIREIGPLVVSALDKAVVDHPDDLVALRMKAQALALTGQYAKALQIADSLLKSTPSYERCWMIIALMRSSWDISRPRWDPPSVPSR